MDNKFPKLPKDLSEALASLMKASEKHRIPLFCLLPIPFDPYYITNFNPELGKLVETNRIFTRELLSIQYHYVATVKYEPEMIDCLKTLKNYDPNFSANARKYLAEAGLSNDLILRIIAMSSIKDKVDYSFTKRLAKREKV